MACDSKLLTQWDILRSVVCLIRTILIGCSRGQWWQRRKWSLSDYLQELVLLWENWILICKAITLDHCSYFMLHGLWCHVLLSSFLFFLLPFVKSLILFITTKKAWRCYGKQTAQTNYLALDSPKPPQNSPSPIPGRRGPRPKTERHLRCKFLKFREHWKSLCSLEGVVWSFSI